MSEVRTPVIPIRVTYKCPECKTGHLNQYGVVWDSLPPSYTHTCDNKECGFSTMLEKKYPRIEYETDKSKLLY